MKRIYLDHAASTPVDPRVLDAMAPYFTEKFGNPGSVHSFGQEAIAAVDRARETITKALGAGFRQLVFTASATEANNLAIHGTLIRAYHTAMHGERQRIIISSVEHESIAEMARDAERMGVELVIVPVDAHGIVDEKKIKENLTSNTALVSIMYAQNEVGSIQPIRRIADAIKEFRGKNAYPLFHTDAAQALQFLDCNVDTLGVDLMTISSHKIYGPKGVGALYIKDINYVEPAVLGGGQEFGLRSGTENVPAIVGFAKAVELAMHTREAESQRIAALKESFWQGIKKIFPKAQVNGLESGANELPNILNIYFPGHLAQDLLTKLDLNGVAASSGSACRSRALEASYVIEAMGYPRQRAKESVRFSFGRPTTEEDIKEALRNFSGKIVVS